MAADREIMGDAPSPTQEHQGSAQPLTEIGWEYPGNVEDELGFPCVVDHDGMAVCSVLDDGIDEIQQEARCRLIAAAPDLLEALKAAAEVVRDDATSLRDSCTNYATGYVDPEALDEIVRMERIAADAFAAIRKAETGEGQ